MMRLTLIATLLSLSATTTMACPMHLGKMKEHAGHHGSHDAHMTDEAKASPSTTAYQRANAVMHKDMDIVFSGDADIDFLKGMIAHHQGAVDMAQVQLAYGRNATVKRLAREIIRAQNLEIRWMKNYLAQLEKQGPRPVALDAKPKATWTDEGWLGKTWLGQE